MSIPCKFERSILSYDEHEIILRSLVGWLLLTNSGDSGASKDGDTYKVLSNITDLFILAIRMI
jgi:hypothetical protein